MMKGNKNNGFNKYSKWSFFPQFLKLINREINYFNHHINNNGLNEYIKNGILIYNI